MNMISVKLCMVAVLIELYPSIPLSLTLIVFQGHSSAKQFKLRILCSYPTQLKLCTIVDYIKKIMNIPLFFYFCTYSIEVIDIFPCLKKIFNVSFFFDSIKARSFKLCIIITLLWLYIVLVGLVTLTLFQGHRFVRNMNCRLHVLDSYFCF